MIEEVWKDIKGYEGYYQISSIGRIKSIERIDCSGRCRKEKMLTPDKLKKGYLRIGLNRNGLRERFLVHRLVAEAFIPNPENKPFIDHINCKRSDNRAENLRWVTNRENCNNPISIKKYSECRTGDKNYSSKPVIQFNSNNKIIRIWVNSREAERQTNINNGVIRGVCRQLYGRKTAGKYKWRYLEDQLADWLEEIQDEDIINERVA